MMDNSKRNTTQRRTRVFPVSPLRLKRHAYQLILSDVAAAADISLATASYIERGVIEGKPEQVAALYAAIERLHAERNAAESDDCSSALATVRELFADEDGAA